MNIVATIGPDHPVVQLRDPKIRLNNLKELNDLSSNPNHKNIITKPQIILAIYSSIVHLQYGESVTLAQVNVFHDDSVFIIIDTTIPQKLKYSENIADYIADSNKVTSNLILPAAEKSTLKTGQSLDSVSSFSL